MPVCITDILHGLIVEDLSKLRTYNFKMTRMKKGAGVCVSGRIVRGVECECMTFEIQTHSQYSGTVR